MENKSRSRERSKSIDVKKCLILKSPVGSKSAEYFWPLSRRKDEASEITRTIEWVCEDFIEIKSELIHTSFLTDFDTNSYTSMLNVVTKYNKAVEKYEKTRRNDSGNSRLSRCTRQHLKFILRKCYAKSIKDPKELNQYEAFTPEVYGETSFRQVSKVLDSIQPIYSTDRFVDLGSGVGQVVLQFAALTDSAMCLGIEKSAVPANYAKDLEIWFRFWMSFYGKTYSNFKLIQDDFLDPKHRREIQSSNIVFANNFVFGPEVDQKLKNIFADLPDGSRIISSKSFSSLNFRISDRNLSDIGAIMHTYKLDSIKGSVSWTGNPVSYYLHMIDRAKLQRYFDQVAAKKDFPKISKQEYYAACDAAADNVLSDNAKTSTPNINNGRTSISVDKIKKFKKFSMIVQQRRERDKQMAGADHCRSSFELDSYQNIFNNNGPLSNEQPKRNLQCLVAESQTFIKEKLNDDYLQDNILSSLLDPSNVENDLAPTFEMMSDVDMHHLEIEQEKMLAKKQAKFLEICSQSGISYSDMKSILQKHTKDVINGLVDEKINNPTLKSMQKNLVTIIKNSKC